MDQAQLKLRVNFKKAKSLLALNFLISLIVSSLIISCPIKATLATYVEKEEIADLESPPYANGSKYLSYL